MRICLLGYKHIGGLFTAEIVNLLKKGGQNISLADIKRKAVSCWERRVILDYALLGLILSAACSSSRSFPLEFLAPAGCPSLRAVT